jgi:mono/diheme cytochrome c family protein
MMTSPRLLTAVSLIAIAFASACQTAPQSAVDAVVVEAVYNPAERGQQLFAEYCQSCHGVEGRGNGPLADLLKIPPPDLTLIQERASDVFPVDMLATYIDGRSGVESHGSRNMPVWGNIWTDTEGGADADQAVAEQINELIEFIRTIQEDIPDF